MSEFTVPAGLYLGLHKENQDDEGQPALLDPTGDCWLIFTTYLLGDDTQAGRDAANNLVLLAVCNRLFITEARVGDQVMTVEQFVYDYDWE